eukprot:13064.XXX_625055_625171_1 [CDS] Oithona nana genome sequencing.
MYSVAALSSPDDPTTKIILRPEDKVMEAQAGTFLLFNS